MNRATDPPRISLWCRAIGLSEQVCTHRPWPPLSLQAHPASPPPAGDPADAALCTLRNLAVAAKDLACNDFGRLQGVGLGVTGLKRAGSTSLKRAGSRLHELTQGLCGQVPAVAVRHTHRLIMLAECAAQRPRRSMIPATVTGGPPGLTGGVRGTTALAGPVAAIRYDPLVAGEQ